MGGDGGPSLSPASPSSALRVRGNRSEGNPSGLGARGPKHFSPIDVQIGERFAVRRSFLGWGGGTAPSGTGSPRGPPGHARRVRQGCLSSVGLPRLFPIPGASHQRVPRGLRSRCAPPKTRGTGCTTHGRESRVRWHGGGTGVPPHCGTPPAVSLRLLASSTLAPSTTLTPPGLSW